MNNSLRLLEKRTVKGVLCFGGGPRLGSASGVVLNVLGKVVGLVRKLKMNADIVAFVNLDIVYQVRKDFTA